MYGAHIGVFKTCYWVFRKFTKNSASKSMTGLRLRKLTHKSVFKKIWLLLVRNQYDDFVSPLGPKIIIGSTGFVTQMVQVPRLSSDITSSIVLFQGPPRTWIPAHPRGSTLHCVTSNSLTGRQTPQGEKPRLIHFYIFKTLYIVRLLIVGTQ